MKTGIIEVKVKLFLNADVNEDEAREIVENMDYSFDHEMIADAEIIEDDIYERCDE